MDPFIALSALGPLLIDMGKAAIGKWMGGDFKPASVEDWVTMQRQDVERFKALNEAGGANTSYPWVEAIVRLQRPLVAAVALGVWGYSHAVGMPSPAVENFAGAVGFYLFGDRTLFYIRGKQ